MVINIHLYTQRNVYICMCEKCDEDYFTKEKNVLLQNKYVCL